MLIVMVIYSLQMKKNEKNGETEVLHKNSRSKW